MNSEHLDIAVRFIAGGGIIAAVSWLARSIDPRYGGLLAAAPITTTLAFLFTRFGSGQEVTGQLVLASFWFAIPSVLFLLTLAFLIARVDLVAGLAGAFAIWLAVVLIVNRFIAG